MKLIAIAIALSLAFAAPASAHERLAASADTTSTFASHCGEYRKATADAQKELRDAFEVGIHLCERFSVDVRPTLTPAGRRWLGKATRCLLDDVSRTFADARWNHAAPESLFAHTASSHVSCYVESGFCELPASDVVRVFAVIDGTALEAAPRLFGSWAPIAEAVWQLTSTCAARQPAPPTPVTALVVR